MPNSNPAREQYDPRWFIWTIVFLVVTGISLVSYIVFSDSADGFQDIAVHRQPVHKTTKAK